MTDSTDTAPRCSAQTTSNRACRGYARPNHSTCWMHGADIPPEEKRAAKSRGAKVANLARGAAPDLAALAARLGSATSINEIAGTLAEVAGLVLVGQVPPRVGSVVAQLGNAQLKLLERGLNEQLDRLREKLERPEFRELRRAWEGS